MKKNGFTLIETIGVIIVIALVATITIPIIVNSNDRDRTIEQEEADVKAVLDYYLDAHPDKKTELNEMGEIYVYTADLQKEGYIGKITKFNRVTVKRAEDGSYDIKTELQ